MKILFFTDGMKLDGEIWGVYWQEPGKVMGDVLDPKGKRIVKEYPDKTLKELHDKSGHAIETFVLNMDKKTALSFLGKKKDLLDRHKQVAL